MTELARLDLATWWRTAPRILRWIPVLAWQLPGTIWCLSIAATPKRITHEAMHELHGADIHHPWWHFCIRSVNPFRCWIHYDPAARQLAVDLLAR